MTRKFKQRDDEGIRGIKSPSPRRASLVHLCNTRYLLQCSCTTTELLLPSFFSSSFFWLRVSVSQTKRFLLPLRQASRDLSKKLDLRP